MRDVASQFREYARLDKLRAGPGLSPDDLARWKLLKRKLGQHFHPDLPDKIADQRESVRIPTKIAVSYSNEGELASCLMTNLSRRGVYVSTVHVMDIGARFELGIHIDNPPLDLTIPVEVISQNVGPGYQSGEPGMGLRFLDTTPETEATLAKLYERLVR